VGKDNGFYLPGQIFTGNYAEKA